MIDRLLDALVQSKNGAADDVLLEAVRLGSEAEQHMALGALLRRRTVRGLSGVVARFDKLPESCQQLVLREIKVFHAALRECGRSEEPAIRLAAMRLVALGRQGKLGYVLTENLHHTDATISRAAAEAMVELARWVAEETLRLQGSGEGGAPAASSSLNPEPRTLNAPSELLDQRPEIESAVARAMDVHRGKHLQELLRAALLLCDWPGSRTLGILQKAKHGGQSAMVRRLQQPPAAEHVAAFLLGASHGGLRSHFGVAFSHIDEAPVLDALLHRTHWLKDWQLQLCVHQVNRGAWLDDAGLTRDIDRRTPAGAALVGEWVGASGAHDVMQDERLERLRQHAMPQVTKDNPGALDMPELFAARVRLLRVAARRRRGACTHLLKSFLHDPDERIVRMAAREIARRRPPEYETALLQLMTTAGESVRRVVGRAIGQAGFDQLWRRYDRLDRSTRVQAGRAMFKLLPDAPQRLARRLATGPAEQKLKALHMAHELGLAEALLPLLVRLAQDASPRLRSKAITVIGGVPAAGTEVLVERLLNDSDARVRANVVEVLERRRDQQLVPVLAERVRSNDGRERANAIKALHTMKVGTAGQQLQTMLRDDRADHRVSALWVLKQVGWWQLLGEVGRIAKEDRNLRVRRYALGVLKSVAEMAAAKPLGGGSGGEGGGAKKAG